MYRIAFEFAQKSEYRNKDELRMIIMQRSQHYAYDDTELSERPWEVRDIMSVDTTVAGRKALFEAYLTFTALKDMREELDSIEEVALHKNGCFCRIEDHHALRDALVEAALKLMLRKEG